RAQQEMRALNTFRTSRSEFPHTMKSARAQRAWPRNGKDSPAGEGATGQCAAPWSGGRGAGTSQRAAA
ncbi:hypothetical protein, partial [Burkholderia thailandensis]|uniref:hypothetical protein n=1 Tax=Burkholderia thailandensis TaxID=57975 RepID=UPI00217ED4DA